MSITAHWRPVSKKDYTFVTAATSHQFEKLVEVFGTCISPPDAEKLRIVQAITGEDFWGEVADAVEKYGAISVWDTY